MQETKERIYPKIRALLPELELKTPTIKPGELAPGGYTMKEFCDLNPMKEARLINET